MLIATIFASQENDPSYLKLFTSNDIVEGIEINSSKNNNATKSIKATGELSLNEDDIYENFSLVMYENEYLNAFHMPYDAKYISKCRRCIDLLKKYIFEINIDDDQFRQMVNWIALINPAIKSITHAAYRIDTELK